MPKAKIRPTPLNLTVLGMLGGGPLHPYAIQSRMKAWGKDRVVDVSQRATLYKTIERLRVAGLIEVKKTERDQRFPERTGLRADRGGIPSRPRVAHGDAGHSAQRIPRISGGPFLSIWLTPDEAASAFETRARLLREGVAELDRELRSESGPPRLFLLETEYIRAVTAAELKWVDSVVDDLRAGRLEWKIEDFRDIAKNFTPPDPI